MKLLLVVCFLFVFCHGPQHRSVAKSYPQDNIKGGKQDTTGKSCAQITKGFDSWGNQDDWVSEFPANQQRRVLQCLDKLWKQEQQGKINK